MKHSFHLRWRRTLLTVLGLTIMTAPALALNVGGRLSSGAWRIADSPVRVTADLQLPEGERLDIHPGVRVEFTGPYQFLVNGTLRAIGSRDSVILFTAAQPAVDSLRWRGIRMVGAGRETELRHCRVEFGWARGAWPRNCGGGVYIENCSPRILRTTVINNRADSDGGGIYGWFTTSLLQNNLVVENYSGNFGGGIYLAYSNSRIQNCTVAFDTARGWGGGIYLGSEAKPTIVNCIITNGVQERWNGSLQEGDEFFSDIARAQSADPTVSFSCVRDRGSDAFPGPGNIIVNPEFVNVANRPFNYRLKPSSPCVDAGDPNMNADGEPDRLANIINMGSYGGTEEATLSLPVFFNDLIGAGVSLQFGDVRINQILTREVRVENRGHYRLFVRDIQFNSPAFSVDSARVDTITVPAYRMAPVEPGEKMKIIVGFTPSALNPFAGRMTFITSDTLQPSPVLNLTGTGIDPRAVVNAELDFGSQRIDVDTTRQIAVRNEGRSELRLTSLTLQGDGFTARIANERIAAGQTGFVNVTFRPTRPSSFPATLTIRSNDRNLLVNLNGIGVGPKMVIADTSRFMGYVYVGGDTVSRRLTIYNNGNQPLEVTGATVSRPAVFSAALPAGGLTIAPTDSGQITLRFHPQQANQTINDSVVVRSGNYALRRSVKLSGRGMAEPGRYVFGHVGGTWDWDAGNAIDYIVLDSVYVPSHQRLKIEAGARILLEPGAKFIVDGSLRAVGLPDARIQFMPRDASGTAQSRWYGLSLANEDDTRLVYCTIGGAARGVRIRESSPTLQFCRIYDNGDSAAAVASLDGGGVYLENSGAIITGCVIEGNYARYGGGLFLLNSKPVVSNNTVRNNYAREGGGAFLRFQSTALFQNNLIYWNRAGVEGGGIKAVDHSNPRIVNCNIAANEGGGIVGKIRSVPVVTNTVVWGNNGGSFSFDAASNGLVSYSDIQGGYGGTANLDTLPGFRNMAAGDFLLTENSPLKDRGNPEPSYRDYYFPPSLGTMRNDIGAYGGPFGGGWAAPELSVSVFQNPAFPRWLDIFITASDSITGAPACTLEWEVSQHQAVALSPLGPYSWRGQWQAPDAGSALISVAADIAQIGRRRVSRQFEVALLRPGQGGTIGLSGVPGTLTIAPETYRNELLLVTASGEVPPRSLEGLVFVTPPIYVRGMDVELDVPATIMLSLPGYEGWDEEMLQRLAIYRRTAGGYEKLDGGWLGDALFGKTRYGGTFVAALGTEKSQKHEFVPRTHTVLRAYPNPFNQRVTLDFTLDEATNVQLSVYEMSGRQVITLLAGALPAGRHAAVWDGRSPTGGTLSSGIYWARLHTAREDASVKLLLLR